MCEQKKEHQEVLDHQWVVYMLHTHVIYHIVTEETVFGFKKNGKIEKRNLEQRMKSFSRREKMAFHRELSLWD